MAIAVAFLGVFLLLPLIIVFIEALAKGIGAYTASAERSGHAARRSS